MNLVSQFEQECESLIATFERIKANGEALPLIERDILLAKLRDIYVSATTLPVTTEYAMANKLTEKHSTEVEPTTIEETSKDEETKEDIKKTQAANEEYGTAKPLFAPSEAPTDIEAPAEPLMAEAEKNEYDELFVQEDNRTENLTKIEDENTTYEEPSAEGEEKPEESDNTAEMEQQETEESPITEPTPEQESTESTEIETEATENKKEAKQPNERQELSLFEYLTKEPGTKTGMTIGDKFEQEQRTISDHVTHQSATHKVSDLRTIININDKFSFVGALFHNNMRAYTDFILRLNAIENRAEATQYISEIAQQYNWNMDSIEVKTFNKILDRKF